MHSLEFYRRFLEGEGAISVKSEISGFSMDKNAIRERMGANLLAAEGDIAASFDSLRMFPKTPLNIAARPRQSYASSEASNAVSQFKFNCENQSLSPQAAELSEQPSPSSQVLRDSKNSTLRMFPQQEQLKNISSRLSQFERNVEKDTTSYLTRESTRMQSFNNDLESMERALALETKGRCESIRNLHTTFENQLQLVAEKVQQCFTAKLSDISSGTCQLDEKLSELESIISGIEKDDVDRRLSARIAKACEEIYSIKTSFTSNCDSRQQNFEERWLSLERAVESRFSEERGKREKKIASLRSNLVEFQKDQASKDEAFQNSILRELLNAKERIAAEVQNREQADEDIVVALNQYTQALHEALDISA